MDIIAERHTSFNPLRHGFHFTNSAVSWSFMGQTGRYLCGGMSYASLDYFESGQSIPADRTPPRVGSHLNTYLLNRQMNAHQFMLRTLPFKAAHHSVRDQFEWGMRLEDDFGRVVRRID